MTQIFFESIRVKDWKIHNIEFHNKRVNSTRKEIFGISEVLDLRDYMEIPDNNFYKCRIEYGEKIYSVEFAEYNILERKRFKIVKIADDIDYSFKTTEREFIDKAFSQRGDCDDIIMQRWEYLTDSSVANIACYIDWKWITPSNPISQWTTRARYLEMWKITEWEIKISDIKKIKKFAITNALFWFLEIKDFKIIV